MLIDHIGFLFFPGATWMRCVGRIAFPIYCFLIAEGYAHTRNIQKYLQRMIVGILLAELPYDLAFSGGITFKDQSVMFTLTLGLLMIYCLNHVRDPAYILLVVLAFYCIGDFLAADYGGAGILLVAAFGVPVIQTHPRKILLQSCLLTAICLLIPSKWIYVGAFVLPVQIFALLAVPIVIMYNGKMRWYDGHSSHAVRYTFYIFYPLHLLVLALIKHYLSN